MWRPYVAMSGAGVITSPSVIRRLDRDKRVGVEKTRKKDKESHVILIVRKHRKVFLEILNAKIICLPCKCSEPGLFYGAAL